MNDKPLSTLPGDRPVRLAVAGLGSAAQLLHLPVLSDMDEVQLVGLCDTETYKVSMVSDKFGVSGYLDVEQMLDTIQVDVLLICTPTNSHLPIALTALEKGVHVIVEKPVARTLEETQRMAEAARSNGRLALVAMNQRFRRDTGILRNYLEQGTMGDIWRVRSGWLKRVQRWNHSPWLDEKVISGGGVLMDLGVQLLDTVLWTLNYPRLNRVTAHAHRVTLDREVEDTITALLEFEDGPVLQLDCSWGLRAERDVIYTYVEGTEAAASLPGLTLTELGDQGLTSRALLEDVDHHDLYSASFRNQLHQFVQMLRGEIEPMSTAEEALAVMDVIGQLYRSAAEGREIRLDDEN